MLNSVVHTVFPSVVVTHFVAMIHEEIVSHQSRMSLGEVGRNSFSINLGFTTLHLCRVSEVTVVGDTTILLVEHIVAVVESLHLITVAYIRAVDTPHEILGSLIVVVTLRIDVVNHRAHLCLLVDVAREDTVKSILIVVFCATSSIRKQSHRHTSIVVFLIFYLSNPCFDYIFKEELIAVLTVEENLSHSRCAIVTGSSIGNTLV